MTGPTGWADLREGYTAALGKVMWEHPIMVTVSLLTTTAVDFS